MRDMHEWLDKTWLKARLEKIEEEADAWTAKLDNPEEDVVRVNWALEMLRAYRDALSCQDVIMLKEVYKCVGILSDAVKRDGVGLEASPLRPRDQDLVRCVLGRDAIQDGDLAGCTDGSIAEYEGAVGAICAYARVAGGGFEQSFIPPTIH